jgi:hypothetical protein
MRIVTWNVAGRRTINSAERFDYQGENPDYFVEQLAAKQPDIVCLQESHSNQTHSVAEELAKELGMPYVFEKQCCPSHIDPAYMLTNAILSREPFADPRATLLPRPSFPLFIKDKPAEAFDRYLVSVQFPGLQVATLQAEPLHFLGHSYDKEPGLTFGRAIDKLLATVLEPPFVLTTDFYVEDLGIPLPELTALAQDVLPANTPTKPQGRKSDHILCTLEWRSVQADVIQTQTDHYLCVADLEPVT